MIVLRSPKGWTGPRVVDGLQVEGTWRSHQVPLSEVRTNPEHLAQLGEWLESYRPGELFDDAGRLRPDVAANAPDGALRMSATPYANGGVLLRDLKLPKYGDHAVPVAQPGVERVSAMVTLGSWLRDVISQNPETFRLFGPDETASNRLQDVYEVTDKVWQYRIEDVDEHLARAGRVMEVLSEHLCQGWLEGYLLTGRHGVFSCYEAFIHIVDSMFNQHAKWLKVHRELAWRRPVASLNYLLSSHVWQQDHNGFSHQDPGFIDHAVNKKAEVIRVYLPPDANTLLSVMEHCLDSRDYVNIVVSGKQPSPTWLGPADAAHHCQRGLGIWEFAGSEVPGEEPDVVLACAGDVPTVETVAAAELLKAGAPGLKIRVVNVVDLMRLQDASEHPHGLTSRDFDGIFTADKPIIFAYHGYPSLIHRLAYRRTNQEGLHVRGYKEEGTTTTAVRHGHAQRDRPLPARHRRDRPGAGPGGEALAAAAGAAGQPDPGAQPHPGPRRGLGGNQRLDPRPGPAAQPGIVPRQGAPLRPGSGEPVQPAGWADGSSPRSEPPWRGRHPGGASAPRATARAVRAAMSASNMSSEAASRSSCPARSSQGAACCSAARTSASRWVSAPPRPL